MPSIKHSLLIAALTGAVATPVLADEIIRHKYASGFPIASAVEVPADKTLVYLGGTVPQVSYDEGEVPPADQTYQQTISVFNSMQERLTELGLDMGDIVQMQVFLVGLPEHGGRMDFDGFMSAYTEYFGTEEQPALPVRSVLQVAGLANEDWVVEIEVVAARP